MFKKRYYMLIMLVVMLFIIGCTAGVNPVQDKQLPDGSIAGFWQGVWHGIILPVAFVVSLFNDKIHIYEVHNNGHLYNLGYLIGI